MEFAPEEAYQTNRGCTLVISDLRSRSAWDRAREQRRAWGAAFADIHRLDNDHVVIAFRPGGARRSA